MAAAALGRGDAGRLLRHLPRPRPRHRAPAGRERPALQHRLRGRDGHASTPSASRSASSTAGAGGGWRCARPERWSRSAGSSSCGERSREPADGIARGARRASALLPRPPHAHLVNTGLGPFYDGVSHFALTPEDLLPGARARPPRRAARLARRPAARSSRCPPPGCSAASLGLAFPTIGESAPPSPPSRSSRSAVWSPREARLGPALGHGLARDRCRPAARLPERRARMSQASSAPSASSASSRRSSSSSRSPAALVVAIRAPWARDRGARRRQLDRRDRPAAAGLVAARRLTPTACTRSARCRRAR